MLKRLAVNVLMLKQQEVLSSVNSVVCVTLKTGALCVMQVKKEQGGNETSVTNEMSGKPMQLIS